jgi:UDP-N-acetylmuramoyl-L-alanyl-D-glutamate--2,6-diaminopimelate ligase
MKNIARSIYHYALSLAGAVLYGFPSRRLHVIGITGTKGKSTTLGILAHILEKSGRKVALISSVSYKIGDKESKNKTGNSMPGRFFLQKFLHDAAKAGCTHALIEVTSQGVVQHRHRFIAWDRGAFLGIHPEHIESHGSFEKYRKAKTLFFSYMAKHPYGKHPEAYIYKEDEHAEYFVRAAQGMGTKYFTKADGACAGLPASLEGEFNKINIAAALAIAADEGIAREDACKALADFAGVQGRMDIVQEKPFLAVVDYAHTPESLEAIYAHMQGKRAQGGRLICVLGSAGGGRDIWKRPAMGKVAERYCDAIVLTDEDPYDEDPAAIISQLQEGMSEEGKRKAVIELDRRAALRKAVEMAAHGDVVLCTGKGSERWIHEKGGRKVPWSERDILKEFLDAKQA